MKERIPDLIVALIGSFLGLTIYSLIHNLESKKAQDDKMHLNVINGRESFSDNAGNQFIVHAVAKTTNDLSTREDYGDVTMAAIPEENSYPKITGFQVRKGGSESTTEIVGTLITLTNGSRAWVIEEKELEKLKTK